MHELCYPLIYNPLMKLSSILFRKSLHLSLYLLSYECVCKLSHISLYMFRSIGSILIPKWVHHPVTITMILVIELEYDIEGLEEISSISRDILEALNRENEGSKPNIEETKVVNLADKGENEKLIKIGVNVPKDMKSKLIALLKEFREIFAWSYQDMPRLDIKIVVHRIPIKPKCPPVRQALRRTKSEIILKIKEEVESN